MTTFINERRKCGQTTEGFGPDAFVWFDFEIRCTCGCWTRDYGDVSEQVGDNPDVQAWLCPTCVKVAEADAVPVAIGPMPCMGNAEI